MFDFAWSELAVIVVVALVVIGPKDLPRVIHGLGKWMRKARAAASEFQRHVDDMVREADLEDVRDEVRKLKIMGKMDAVRHMSALIDPDGKMANALDPTAMGLAASEGAAKLAAPRLDKPGLDKPGFDQASAPYPDKPPAPSLDKSQAPMLGKGGKPDWHEPAGAPPYRAAGPDDLASFPGVEDDEVLDRGAGPLPYAGPRIGPRSVPGSATPGSATPASAAASPAAGSAAAPPSAAVDDAAPSGPAARSGSADAGH